MPNNQLPACPVETTLQLLKNKWTILIVRDLLTGTKRFSQLKNSVTGISQKVLTANLRQMETQGLLNRQVFPQVPPKVEYTLTPLGYTLENVINSMYAWGEDYQSSILS